jgi:hypothetical protein
VSIGDVITLLGAPFWMWHTTDLLEGGFVVPTMTNGADNATEESEGTLALLGIVHVSRLLPSGSRSRPGYPNFTQALPGHTRFTLGYFPATPGVPMSPTCRS